MKPAIFSSPDWRTLRNEELRFSFSGSERKTVFRRYFRLESGLFCSVATYTKLHMKKSKKIVDISKKMW